jgi:Trypsin-like peptidase domain
MAFLIDSDLPAGFVVRLLGPGGWPAGVGVLVGQREIVTCAHVVNAALGRETAAQDQPQGLVGVEFPLLAVAGGGPPARLSARVARWLAPPREGAAGDDFGGLVLEAAELPAGAAPARLAANPPPPGRVVDVFGYPGEPPRPDGGWVPATVRGQVGGGRLQLDSATEAALRVQPGFSGGPVWDRSVGRVVGLIAAAPLPGAGARDSYAISAERLRRAWPEVLDPRGTTTRARTWAGTRDVGGGVAELTVLHVSDPQFGRSHLFGGNGATPADQAYDTLFQRLHDDGGYTGSRPGCSRCPPAAPRSPPRPGRGRCPTSTSW